MTYVVEERDNPSSNYYVLPAILAIRSPVQRLNFRQLPEHGDNALVIFVRYVPKAWRKWVEANRQKLNGVVLFMDDDLLDSRATVGMSWRYRWKLWHLSGSQCRWLRNQEADLWVSTPYLYEKYKGWPAQLVLPSEPAVAAQEITRIFYHGSASHDAEHRWLELIMEPVMQAAPTVRLELVGNAAVHRRWRRFSGVTVIHPMKWPAYRALCDLTGRHIGLAPLLGGRFNQARSYTKFFDITHCGAVGIYSRHPAFLDTIRHEVDGYLLDNDPNSWVEAILSLVRDSDLRDRMHSSAIERVEVLNAEAQATYRKLRGG